jgi:phosphoglucomutase/phosphomannomutase
MKVFIFDGIRTTPELSFAIRYFKAIGGAMYSASHNPPDHNGQKVFDEHGGQLIPPFDEELVSEVTESVNEIKQVSYEQGVKSGMINVIDEAVDQAYVIAAAEVTRSKERALKIVYTPLHGCGITSVPKVMGSLGFLVINDPKTSNPSGRFENVTFNIPNPEVKESFDASLECAKKESADLLLNSDPDADRIGVMVFHKGEWVFLNGDQICSILVAYIEGKTRNQKNRIMIKTAPTTALISRICFKHDVVLIGDLLIGFKYIANELNKLEANGKIGDFLFAGEESYGHCSGNYIREKDACTAAIWLSELSAELKPRGKTIIDYLDDIYAAYGYFNNHQTEIRMLGAVGFDRMRQIMDSLRNNPPAAFGKFKINGIEDGWSRIPIVSQTDRVSKNLINFLIEPDLPGIDSIRAFIRPSGTEPKLKVYFEIGAKPVGLSGLSRSKTDVDSLMAELEQEAMKAWYKIIGIDFPDRGVLLFWQLPLDLKMKYFEIEKDIEKLKSEPDDARRKEKLLAVISFLGADPIGKMDRAFAAKYGQPVLKFLNL